MTPEQHQSFPTGTDFLTLLQTGSDEGSEKADAFSHQSGERLPATMNRLGNVLSVLYRLACCAWGCKGGDHQIEWLTGRIVNQAVGSHRLIRAGLYDEALMVIRGIGENTNLLWLFHADASALESWKASDHDTRRKKFQPGMVRNRLKTLSKIGPPIDDHRYRKLCEVGTHPVPGFAPGHFNGTGRPVLGIIPQPAGIYASATELGYAVGMAALPISKLLDMEADLRTALGNEALKLISDLGQFNVLNYESLLAQAHEKHKARMQGAKGTTANGQGMPSENQS
ncbi:TPA: hypothetical protein VMX41_001800 [Streptococcus pyogenes]|nr:hypothetical protein [Streptococcus pyogenes]